MVAHASGGSLEVARAFDFRVWIEKARAIGQLKEVTGSMPNSRTLGLTMGIEEKLDTMALTNRISEKLQLLQSNAADYPIECVDVKSVSALAVRVLDWRLESVLNSAR